MFANVVSIKDGKESDSSKLKALKEKCIKAVDMLSSNPSLWTVIVAHFVPNFLENWITSENAHGENDQPRSILYAGLQTILRVIALPTHAVFVANTGLAASLSNIICVPDKDKKFVDPKVEGLAIKIIITLLSYSGTKGPSAERVEPGIVDVYAVDVACHLLSRDSHIDQNISMTTTKQALEIFLTILETFDNIPISDIAKSTRIIGFIETVVCSERLLKKLCATAFLSTFDDSFPGSDSSSESLYGKPIVIFEGLCGKYVRSSDAALNIFCWISFYSVMSHSQNSKLLWDTIMLVGTDIADNFTKYVTITTISANFLQVLSLSDSCCAPKNPIRLKFFHDTVLPIVQERFLHVLYLGCEELLSETCQNRDYLASFQKLCTRYRIPQLCLQLSSNSSLTERAFEVLQFSLSGYPRTLLEPMMSDKLCLTSLFNTLGFSDEKGIVSRHIVGKVRFVSAAILSSAGEYRLLGVAVNGLGLRSFAVASLSAACLMEDDDAELSSGHLMDDGLSMSTLCLNGLIDVLSYSKNGDEKKVMLSLPEAKALSHGLGKKLSAMVMERFLHKAEREHVLGDMVSSENIQKFPEVILLCALASSRDSLAELCTCGGLEALSLVASEGELLAINALLEVSFKLYLSSGLSASRTFLTKSRRIRFDAGLQG
jgi:hypothetical protein